MGPATRMHRPRWAREQKQLSGDPSTSSLWDSGPATGGVTLSGHSKLATCQPESQSWTWQVTSRAPILTCTQTGKHLRAERACLLVILNISCEGSYTAGDLPGKVSQHWGPQLPTVRTCRRQGALYEAQGLPELLSAHARVTRGLGIAFRGVAPATFRAFSWWSLDARVG